MKFSIFARPHVGRAFAFAGLAATVPIATACAQIESPSAGRTAPVAVSSRLVASLSQAGLVTVRQGEGENSLLTIAPRLFEKGWQLRSLGTGGKGFASEHGALVTQGTINATNAGSQVTVRTEYRIGGDEAARRLNVTCTLTADKDTPIEAAFLGLSLPVGTYAGAPFTVGETRGTVPTSVKENRLGGGTGRLRLGQGANAIAVESASNLLIQDNRTFGSGELEVRAGLEGVPVLKAGEPVTITAVIELPGALLLEKEEPVTITAGNDWLPLPVTHDILPGSALDFRPLFPVVPVEKTGWVTVRPDGHFGFEKGSAKPIRFYGVNLCFSANYLPHEEADRFADRMLALGFNTLRIHHYEGDLIDPSRPDSLTFKQESLDRLDYLVAACKKRGIYVKTDLFVSRPVKPEESGVEGGMDNFKAAVLVSPPAMQNWKEFSRRLLTHVNPYTRIAWKDEPTVSFLSVVNEPNATNYLSGLSGKLAERFEAEWAAWLRASNRPQKVMPRTVNDTPEGREMGAFLAHLHRRAFAEMKTFLRGEIKTRALLTDNNGWSEFPALMSARTQLDWVDNHFYWDHPRFLEKDWQLPSGGYSDGRSALGAGGAGPNANSMTRLYGKPFTLSEFDYPAPNRYRAEGSILTAYAGALQDWDALWKFAYSHDRDSVIRPGSADYFNAANDPVNLASDRLAVLLFRRGDAKPAPTALSRILFAPELTERFTAEMPPGFADLTLVTRVGTRVTGQDGATQPPKFGKDEYPGLPGEADALTLMRANKTLPRANRTDLAKGVRESQTGEMTVTSSPETLRLVTPRTVAVIASPSEQPMTAGPLTVRPGLTRATVYVTSLDGKPIAQSGRLLVAHLTDVQNTGARFAGPDRKVLEAWGSLPHLAQRGQAQVTLAKRKPGRVQAWRLDTSGKRLAPLAATASGGRLTLPLDTRASDGTATLYYEVVIR